MPETVGKIVIGGFRDCSLTSIHLPAALTEIGRDAFDSCDLLTEISVDESNELFSNEDGILYNKDKTILYVCPGGKGGTIILPETVETIAEDAFYKNYVLEAIEIPVSVTLIESNAFSDCKNMEVVYYRGSEEEWNVIKIQGDGYNGRLFNATVRYNSKAIINPFTDITSADYFFDAVLWAADNEVTTGLSATSFAPYKECSRADIVTFLYRAMGGTPSDKKCSFIDVNPSEYYYEPMMWAVEQGITTGMTKNTFAPYALCTREQIVTFIWRALGEPQKFASIEFEDVTRGDYFYDPVRWAVRAKVTTGQTPETFGSYKACTRADSVLFMMRALTE